MATLYNNLTNRADINSPAVALRVRIQGLRGAPDSHVR
jgi:hypothetical protein